jgi:uncharacterized protein YdhG (YjbR/CyaY superfamily)
MTGEELSVPSTKLAAIRPVDDYIRAQPTASQPVLERVRGVLRKALPGADEVLSYGIPAYRLNGRIVIFFAAWKRHYSIYPAGDPGVLAAFEKELASCEISKGTIRFPLERPVPAKLIAAIAKFRAARIASGPQRKTAARPKGRRRA